MKKERSPSAAEATVAVPSSSPSSNRNSQTFVCYKKNPRNNHEQTNKATMPQTTTTMTTTTTTATTATTTMLNNRAASKKQMKKGSPSQRVNGVPTNNKIADTSIMAPSYVPEELRRIFFVPVARYIPIAAQQPQQQQQQQQQTSTINTEPLVLLAQRLFFSAVAPVPACTCGRQQQHVLPWMTVPQLPPMEPGFVHHDPRGLERASPGFSRTFPSIFDVSSKGRDAYIQLFEQLIREEYEETMMLYERYTQYGVTVTPIKSQEVQSQQNQQHRAIIAIPGIADARPPLQTGDKVLLRYFIGKHYSSVVELETDVIRTLRSNGKSRQIDQVVIAWCDDGSTTTTTTTSSTNNKQKTTPFASLRNIPNGFAVRFLPNIKMPERCLTALRWLQQVHPSIAKNLLFPSEAPVILPSSSTTTSTTTRQHDNNKNNNDTIFAAGSTPLSSSSLSSSSPMMLLVDATDPRNVMNEQQSKFCRMVLKRTNHPSFDNVRPPMILTGPAGTGKTKALLMSILNALAANDGNRILVCTPSHTAADVIAKRLLQHFSNSNSSSNATTTTNLIFRLCDATRPVETAPVELLPIMRQNANGDFTLPTTAAELMNFRVIVCTCLDAHSLYLAGITNASLRSRRQCLTSFIQQAVAASPGMSMMDSSTSILLKGADTPHFTHLFIDEAAQATEPETLIPFSVVVDDAPNVQKVEIALTGDPRQLHPETNSPWARPVLQLGLLERLLQQGGGRGRGGRRDGREREHMLGPPTKDSWVTMEELIEYSLNGSSNSNNDSNTSTNNNNEEEDYLLSTFLTLSYRGHPSFLLVPSKLFYFDKLRSVHNAHTVDNKWCDDVLRKIETLATCKTTQDGDSNNDNSNTKRTLDFPIHFRGVVGNDTSVAVESCWGSNSWSNPQEANAIVEIAHHMVVEAGVPTQSIGIMAAFRAQVVLIRKLLRQHANAGNLGAINVGMVEDYQAVEREVVLLSLTRSNPRFIATDVQRNAGLFRQPKRMNVALTRAERLLVVVGNPNTMEQDPYWKEWLAFCGRHGLWYQNKKNENDNGEEDARKE